MKNCKHDICIVSVKSILNSFFSGKIYPKYRCELGYCRSKSCFEAVFLLKICNSACWKKSNDWCKCHNRSLKNVLLKFSK